MSDPLPVILTRHSIERARERLGLTEAQLSRLMGHVHQRGATREFLDARTMRFFDRIVGHQKDAMRESVIHDGHLFVIERGILITIKPVPPVIARKALAAAKLNRLVWSKDPKKPIRP